MLFAVSDADLREFRLIVPGDCVASIEPRYTRQALEHMQRVLRAGVVPSTALALS